MRGIGMFLGAGGDVRLCRLYRRVQCVMSFPVAVKVPRTIRLFALLWQLQLRCLSDDANHDRD